MKKTTLKKHDNEILSGLNAEQQRAVTHDTGPLLIIAGAGTGKTRVITSRIAHLIATKKAKPSEILALTFTDKAASEMEERVDIMVPYGFNDVWISTFHAFGDRILRENALAIGISPDALLLTQSEAAVFFKENLFSFPMKLFRPLGNPAQYIAAMLTAFSRAKDEAISPQEYVLFSRHSVDAARTSEEKETAQRHLEVARTYEKYEELKKKHNYLDFGDQVMLARELLTQHPALLHKYQHAFKYVLVDEFQDTNYAQFELVQLLCQQHRNITVVGDDDQSIYKFRGACLSNILSFTTTYPESTQIVLRKNYRSTQAILNAAYKLITQNNPERLEIRNHINKELTAERAGGPEVYHKHYDALSTEADEVARCIKEKVENKEYTWRDFAILVRSNNAADQFLKSLNMLGIPWYFSGNQGLYTREEIRLLLAFLRVMANPEDSISLYYLLASPLYGFDPAELAQINHVAAYHRRSLLNALRSENTYSQLKDISEITKNKVRLAVSDLDFYYGTAQKNRTGELLYLFLKKSGTLDRLYNAQSVREVEQAQNIAKFFRIIERYSRIATYDRVNTFVEHIDALLSVGDDPSVAELDVDLDTVNVLTYHKAKGLEFPVVFMVSLVEDRFPSRNKHDLIEIPTALVKDVLPQGDFHIQEERRLFYVGMTRAKNELFLTSARDYGGKREKKISRFVKEALDKPQADAEAYTASVKETIERFAPAPESADHKLILPGEEGMLKLSPYAVDDYLTCPLKYKYVHILRVPILRHHTLVFGEVVHRVLKEYYRAKQEKETFNEEQLVAAYTQYWSSAGFLSREHEEERFRNGKEILIAYFRQQEAAGIIPLSVEEEFKCILGKDLRITGRWDRLDERQESGRKTRIIVDFKTTARVKDQEAADKEIKQSKQLIIYALGYSMKYGALPDYVELHFLEPGLIARLAITEKMLEEIKKDIRTVSQGIQRRNFEARPAFMACQFCAYSNICPAQQKE